MVVAEDRGRLRDEVDAAIRDDGGFDCFVTIRRGDGELRDLRVRGAVHRAAGGPRHLIGICQDLTDIRAAERERAELAERFRVRVRARAGGDRAGRPRRDASTWSTRRSREFLGRRATSSWARGSRTSPTPTTWRRAPTRSGRMAAGELDEWNTEKRYVRPDGEVRWGALRALLLHDAEGRSTQLPGAAPRRHRAAARRAPPRRRPRRAERDGRRAATCATRCRRCCRRWSRSSAGSAGRCGCRTSSGAPALEAAWPRGSAAARPAGPAAGAGGQRRRRDRALEFEYEPREHAGAELEAFAATLGAQVGEFIVRRRAEEQRLHEALHDPLTGLPNRVLFFDRLDHAMRRQQREHAPLAVLFLDFDGFKAVNDRFGHAGGDERAAPRARWRSRRRCAAEDTVARFGGDELVVLSEHMYRPRLDARGIAERILETPARRRCRSTAQEVTLSASIGICLAPVEGRSRDELLSQRGPRDVPRQGRRARALRRSPPTDAGVPFRHGTSHPHGHHRPLDARGVDGRRHEAIERAVAEFRRELDAGYYAMVTEGEGHARQVAELPLDAELVILRRPIAGG